MSLEKENLVGYVIMGAIDPDTTEVVARLLYDEFRTTQNWFPLVNALSIVKIVASITLRFIL